MSGFSVSNLSSGYGGKRIVDGMSFSLGKGRLMGLIGANGCGKTTLIKSICGIHAHEGQCMLDGTRLEGLSAKPMARLCAYIPQRSGISIDISAIDVVLMGFNPRLGILQHPSAAMRENARMALEQVGLGGREDMNYLQLSEGQKQLCVLARALVSDCRLLLLDEPESALDFRLRYRMLEIIRSWVREDRYGLIALHDPVLALNVCDELLIMKDGKAAGILKPVSDSMEYMEDMLSQVYGRVCLLNCNDRNGKKHMVMLKEQEGER